MSGKESPTDGGNTRREVLVGMAAVSTAAAILPSFAQAASQSKTKINSGDKTMGTITVKDGTEIFYKDWARANQSYSTMDGRSAPTTGTRRCCSFWRRVFA